MPTAPFRFAGPAAAVVSLLLCFGLGEIALRAYRYIRYGSNVLYVVDSRLGWRASKCLRRVSDPAAQDEWMSQDENGFRRYDAGAAGKRRLFVLGDSYTMADDIPDGKPYFSIVGDRANLAVFAYGCGGYGSLQEYMVLDQYLGRIRPDVILWQFCSNDFINNLAELETASTQNNNGMVRPYYVNGKIQYALPSRFGQIRGSAIRHSALVYFVLSRIDRIVASMHPNSIEDEIAARGSAVPSFRRAWVVTDEIMRNVRSRAGGVPIIAFGCDSEEPYASGFAEIAARHDIVFLRDVAAAVESAERRGLHVRTSDGFHWNELGHRIVAERILSHLRSSGLAHGK